MRLGDYDVHPLLAAAIERDEELRLTFVGPDAVRMTSAVGRDYTMVILAYNELAARLVTEHDSGTAEVLADSVCRLLAIYIFG